MPFRITTNSLVALFLVGVALAIIAFSGPLAELVNRWTRQEEYGHGFLIPLITLWLLWSRREMLAQSIGKPTWAGPAVVLLAIGLHVLAELSAIYFISQLAFILLLIGLVLACGGLPLLSATILPISLLVFAIPPPYFVESLLTWRLQLVSSELGVLLIRAFHIPVFLEGNVIDLGNYKVQVVEACSGLRYLYPLLCISFLTAYLFRAPLWQRAIVFLSAVPITIVMNSLRIGLVAILVNSFGTQMADGAIHFFEGWVIFLLCAAILLGEVALFARLSGTKVRDVFGGAPKLGPLSSFQAYPRVRGWAPPAIVCISFLFVAAVAGPLASYRTEFVPYRERFASFPSRLGDWKGHASVLEPSVEQFLDLDDYLLSDFEDSRGGQVNAYVAYYASQRKGVYLHSPLMCIPAGGWIIVQFDRTNVGDTPFNRAVITKGGRKQLVYYWFVQRGRKVANEFWAKWHFFSDAILQNRSDGALVRITTPVYAEEALQNADMRLQSFMSDFETRLDAFLPPKHMPSVPAPVAYRIE